MMGHREPMKGGEEYDAFTKWRHVLRRPRGGGWHRIKQKFWRRIRAEIRRALRTEEHE